MAQTDIATTQPAGMGVVNVANVTEDTVRQFLGVDDTKLTKQQSDLFLSVAVRSQLDPFRREIYAIPYNGQMSIVTAYTVYIQRANRSGLLNGYSVLLERDDAGKPVAATVTIHRKDWEHPFEWTVEAAEFRKNTATWKDMPGHMLKKTAIGQAFRLAFPDDCAGLPYTQAELDLSAGLPERNITPDPAQLTDGTANMLATLAEKDISEDDLTDYCRRTGRVEPDEEWTDASQEFLAYAHERPESLAAKILEHVGQ